MLPVAHLQRVGLNDLHELGANGVGVEGTPPSGRPSGRPSVATRSSSTVLAWEATGLRPGLAAWSSIPARLLSSAVLAWEASRLSILTRSTWQAGIGYLILQHS